MSEIVGFTAKDHRVFGRLGALAIGSQPLRVFTREEALILSRALDAVADGASPELQIFMSPIASDHDFEAQAQDGGASVKAQGFADVALDRKEIKELAATLRRFAE